MEPHQQRVVNEKAELDSKLEKLNAFIISKVFSTLNSQDAKLLLNQSKIMDDYSNILGSRIDLFKHLGDSK